jgi:hypothetical protein
MSVIDVAELFAFCDLHASRWRARPVVQGFLSRPMYYDRQGFALPGDGDMPPPLVWARLLEHDPDYRTVARDELPDGSLLSTVWLGLDHAHGFGAPLIFETMRFAAEDPQRPNLEFPDPHGKPDETTEQLRYTTEEEALAAHHEIVRRFRVRLGH